MYKEILKRLEAIGVAIDDGYNTAVDTEENSDSMYYTNHASDLLNELMVSVEKQVQSEREEIPNFEGTMGALENL
jgi:hypothetical protein|tara:strand:- start:1016 stop:1240 length:225 start_codon:yes stop_codon:yes gene_type:complete